ncbi:MAG: histidine kinase [Desertifilum sp. SIO1I2]|nr:histidine kinase [Desertifilum sp. SIO1I2]
MDAGKQQILGYFIEEAKEHLDTLEQGLLDLQSTMKDTERVNEMFRAAHSVKGGAAMLGFSSIQKIAHRLEDGFKILKEYPITPDQKLESLFIRGFDPLRDLLGRLQGPFGLRDEEADQLVQEAEPIFNQLQAHLNELLGEAGISVEDEEMPVPAAQRVAPPEIVAQVTAVLRQMLQQFRQAPNPANRQELEQLCGSLLNVGETSQTWQNLIQTAQSAIANPQFSYVTLAPLVIKEIRQASELVQAGRVDEVSPSSQLQQLAAQSEKRRIALTVEPNAAAEAIIAAFNQQQLSQLIERLQTAVK